MYTINKLDYFVGAFVSYVVSKEVAPALFDGTDDSKIVAFATNSDEYTVYLKYSTAVKTTFPKGKITRKWNIFFTNKDMDILVKNRNNANTTYVVLICAEPNLRQTEICVIDIKKALLCLGEDAVNKQKRITVTHSKGSPNLQYYGSMKDKQDSISVIKNFDTYFNFEKTLIVK